MGWGRHCCLLLLFFSEILSSWKQQEPPGESEEAVTYSGPVESWKLLLLSEPELYPLPVF